MKSYREGKNDTATHDGKQYNINKIFEIAEKKHHLISITVNQLTWMVDETDLNYPGFVERVRKANTAFPIIVTKWKDKWVTLDGFHRVCKAVFSGDLTIEAKVIEEDELKHTLIK